MKIEAKKLADLNKQYSKLKKDEKIISLTEARKMLDDIIEKQEKLEELLSEQMMAIETYGDACGDDSCGCEEVEQSELYEVYSDLEDLVVVGRLHRALRMIS
jgi:diphthamide biosynthesis methyltransferase